MRVYVHIIPDHSSLDLMTVDRLVSVETSRGDSSEFVHDAHRESHPVAAHEVEGSQLPDT